MGTVYAARDPKLERTVAVKLLDAGFEASVSEARALARIVTHPNVVAVHDAGQEGSQGYLAMEWVDGLDLDGWLAAADRSPEVVMERLLEAGRGLVAAHGAGVVHRDFKPSNVLVAHDGRVKVTDFGLATTMRANTAETTGGDLRSTRRGTTAGTPLYMAPEQHAGARGDTRSDQYSFCLTAWEALTGVHPLVTLDDHGRVSCTREELVAAKAAGPGDWDPPAIPPAAIEALRRGLDPDPAERWPHLDELLTALTPSPPRRYGRTAALLVMIGAGAGLGGWALARVPPCSGSDAELDDAWSARHHAALAEAFQQADTPVAEAALTQTVEELDAYADAWTSEHEATCEATVVHGTQSQAAMDLRMTCLRRAAGVLAATVEELTDADRSLVANSSRLTAALPDLSRCADADQLQRERTHEPAESDRTAVANTEAALDRVLVQFRAGRYDAAAASLEAAKEAFGSTDHVPTRIDLLHWDGKLHEAAGRYEQAELAAREGLALATRHERPRDVSRAAVELLYVVGVRQRQPERVDVLRELVLSSVEDRDPVTQALVHMRLGNLERARGDMPAAIAAFEHASDLLAKRSKTSRRGYHESIQARMGLGQTLVLAGEYDRGELLLREGLAELETDLGPEHPEVASLRTDLATSLRMASRLDDAAAEYRAAISVLEDALGPEHPKTAKAHAGLGRTLERQNDLAGGERHLRLALEAMQRSLGEEHEDILGTRLNLATLLQRAGRYEEALAIERSVLEAFERTGDLKHPRVGTAHNNLGHLLSLMGRYEEAETELRRALEIREAALGPSHPRSAKTRDNLAEVLDARGQYADAEREYRSALAIRIAAFGEDHPDVAASRTKIGWVLQAQGRYEQAEAMFRTALEVLTRTAGPDAADAPAIRDALGSVLVELGRYDEAEVEHQAALELTRQRLGDDHPNLAFSLHNLAIVYMKQGKPNEAERLYRDAIARWRRGLGDEHPMVALGLTNLAVMLCDEGRGDEAVPLATEAIALRKDGAADSLAISRFALARALGSDRDQCTRAITLARDARDALIEAGANGADALDEVEQWLRDTRCRDRELPSRIGD